MYTTKDCESSAISAFTNLFIYYAAKKRINEKKTHIHTFGARIHSDRQTVHICALLTLCTQVRWIFSISIHVQKEFMSHFSNSYLIDIPFFYSRSLFLVFTVPCITYFECQIPSRCVWQSTTYIYMCVTISDSVHNVKVYYLLFIRVIHENWKQRQQQRKFTQIKSQSTFVSFEFLYGFSEPNNWRKKNCHFALLFFFFGDFCALWKSVENPYHKYWCVTNFSLFVRRTAISEQ